MSEEIETCEVCQGSGWSGHPDSGDLCYKCKGAGGYPRGDDGTALALYIELGAYFDPKLTEHDRSIVLSKIRSRTSSSQSRLSEAVKVLEWVNAELKDHGYAEIGTLRATVINAIEAAKS